jgi:quercetin dioxygenase-like cupin family protein
LSHIEGSAYWFLNGLYIVKATSQSTGGAFALIHVTVPPGNATPYHLHHNEDEAFYVLDGELTFICDGKKTILGPGGYIFLPRNLPHGLRCTSQLPSTYLNLTTPGSGFVGMMTEAARPAEELTLPASAPPDLEKLKTLCEKYKIDLLGPLPE